MPVCLCVKSDHSCHRSRRCLRYAPQVSHLPQRKPLSRCVHPCMLSLFSYVRFDRFSSVDDFEMGCCWGCHYYDYSINYDSLIKIRNVLLLLTAFFLFENLLRICCFFSLCRRVAVVLFYTALALSPSFSMRVFRFDLFE